MDLVARRGLMIGGSVVFLHCSSPTVALFEEPSAALSAPSPQMSGALAQRGWPCPQSHWFSAEPAVAWSPPRGPCDPPRRLGPRPALPQLSSLLASCLAPRLGQGLACSGCPASPPLPPPPTPIHLPVHFCFQCNVPPQALPPPLLPRLHQPTPYRLNPHGAPTAAIPCGSEL